MRVVLPVVRPGVFTAALFTFLFAYNEFLYCLILTGTRAKPLSVAIAQYGAERIEYWSWSAAGAVGILAPVGLFIVVMQRHLIKGLTFGTLKDSSADAGQGPCPGRSGRRSGTTLVRS